jgi:hypothetical protein
MAGTALAGTFDRTPLAPELGVESLDRTLTRERTGRTLFGGPYASVALGQVDVYDVFPYVESRRFQVVSDPAWDRLVYGEVGRSLHSFDGRGGALGALDEPRGLAVDERRRVYVADTANDRIVILQAATEFDRIELTPLYEITGLHQPYGVAHSDGGTPFAPGDDRLYVADTGRNRIVAYALADRSAREVASIGELGGGRGRFGGPMAIAVGRDQGANTSDVYVADAHGRRIVRLEDLGGALAWVEERAIDADLVTSLDTDRWGNVYAAAPNRGSVQKFSPALAPVAELRTGVTRPRSFHVPFFNVTDHRDGTVVRMGQPNAVLIEDWADASGMKLWSLGVEVADLAVVGERAPRVRFMLTDAAAVTIELSAPDGRLLSSRLVGELGAGVQDLALSDDELTAANAGAAGERVARIVAVSRYNGGPVADASARFAVAGGAVLPPSGPQLLGSVPNPAIHHARIAYLLPQAPAGAVALRLYDARGRLVRTLDPGTAPGLNEVAWDGRDDGGAPVPAGVYFYRLTVGETKLDRRLVWAR